MCTDRKRMQSKDEQKARVLAINVLLILYIYIYIYIQGKRRVEVNNTYADLLWIL